MATAIKTLANKAVTTAGTRVQITTSHILATALTIQALRTNTGYIYVGDSSVAVGQGIELGANRVFSFSGAKDRGGNCEFDLSEVYIDSSVNGEGVRLAYELRS